MKEVQLYKSARGFGIYHRLDNSKLMSVFFWVIAEGYELCHTSDCRGAFFAAVPGDSQGMLKHAKQFQQAAKTAPAQSRGHPGLRGRNLTLAEQQAYT